MEDMIKEATIKLAKHNAQVIDNMEFNKKYIVEKHFKDNMMWIEVKPID